jgi:L-2-hydroxyglutarate oxidase LhgO
MGSTVFLKLVVNLTGSRVPAVYATAAAAAGVISIWEIKSRIRVKLSESRTKMSERASMIRLLHS